MKRQVIMCLAVAVPFVLGPLARSAASQYNTPFPEDDPTWMTIMSGQAKYRVGTIYKCGSGCDSETQACCGIIAT